MPSKKNTVISKKIEERKGMKPAYWMHPSGCSSGSTLRASILMDTDSIVGMMNAAFGKARKI